LPPASAPVGVFVDGARWPTWTSEVVASTLNVVRTIVGVPPPTLVVNSAP